MDLMMHEVGVKKKVGDRVGKAFKQSNGCFVEYSRLCWKNLKLYPEKWSREKAEEVYERCKTKRHEFHAYQQLRTTLSPLIEFVILVDRLVGLLEKVRALVLSFRPFSTFKVFIFSLLHFFFPFFQITVYSVEKPSFDPCF